MKTKKIVLVAVIAVILIVIAAVAAWLLAIANVRHEQPNVKQEMATHKSAADTAANKGDAKTALKEYQLALDACPTNDDTCRAEMKQRIHEMQSAMKVKLNPKNNFPVKKWVAPKLAAPVQDK